MYTLQQYRGKQGNGKTFRKQADSSYQYKGSPLPEKWPLFRPLFKLNILEYHTLLNFQTMVLRIKKKNVIIIKHGIIYTANLFLLHLFYIYVNIYKLYLCW